MALLKNMLSSYPPLIQYPTSREKKQPLLRPPNELALTCGALSDNYRTHRGWL